MTRRGKAMTIRIRVGRRELIGALAAFLALYLPLDLQTESMTLTTFYPAPYGVYQQLRSTGNTYLAYGAATNKLAVGATSVAVGDKMRVVGNLRVEGQNWTKGQFYIEDPVSGAVVSLFATQESIAGMGNRDILGLGGVTDIKIDSGQFIHKRCQWVAYGFPGTTFCPAGTRANHMGPVPNSTGGNSLSGWMGCCQENWI